MPAVPAAEASACSIACAFYKILILCHFFLLLNYLTFIFAFFIKKSGFLSGDAGEKCLNAKNHFEHNILRQILPP
jgi:hypothetical protein